MARLVFVLTPSKDLAMAWDAIPSPVGGRVVLVVEIQMRRQWCQRPRSQLDLAVEPMKVVDAFSGCCLWNGHGGGNVVANRRAVVSSPAMVRSATSTRPNSSPSRSAFGPEMVASAR